MFSPFDREQMINIMRATPWSTCTSIAQEMGRHPSTVRHHLRRGVRDGTIEIDRTRRPHKFKVR